MTYNDKIPTHGYSYTCNKGCDCFYCYEMNRINTVKPETKWVKKTSYQNKKLKEFKDIFDKYKAS